MRLFLISAAAVLGLATMPAAPARAAAQQDADKIVCKTKPRTNSRFGQRTCMTKSEWEKRSAQHKRDAAEMIDRPLIGAECKGGGC